MRIYETGYARGTDETTGASVAMETRERLIAIGAIRPENGRHKGTTLRLDPSIAYLFGDMDEAAQTAWYTDVYAAHRDVRDLDDPSRHTPFAPHEADVYASQSLEDARDEADMWAHMYVNLLTRVAK